MQRTKEEIAADLVWRYVEYIREETTFGRPAAFSRDELEQLMHALETAARVPEALDTEASPAAVAGARAHLHSALEGGGRSGHTQGVPGTRGGPNPVHRARLTFPVPRWAAAAGAVAICLLSLALATVPAWHHGETVVRRVPVPYALPDVQPLSERKARVLIRLEVNNELDTQDERNLMWHMLVCPGCFQRYVRERKEHTPQAEAPDQIALVRHLFQQP